MEEIDKLREDLLSTEQTKGAALVGYKPSDAYPTDTVGNTLNSLEKQNQTNSVKADQAVIVANDAISKATTAEQNTGNALQKGNNLNDVANKTTALSNIGGLPLIDVSTDSSPNKIPRARTDGKIDINWVRDLQYNLSYIQKALNEIKYPDGIIPSIDVDFTVGALHPSVSFSRASETTYYDSTGTLRTAGINEPAFDHDPETLKPLGIQRFSSVTNLARWSGNGSGWSPEGTNPPTLIENQLRGGARCVSITFSAGAGGYASSRAARNGYAWPITSGVQCTYSADIELSRPLVSGEEIVFYATGSSGLPNYTIRHGESSLYVGKWKRVQATGVPGNTGNDWHVIYFNNLQNPITVYVSRIQAEEGDKNYVYIPTQASQVARAADVITVNNINFQEFTYYCRFRYITSNNPYPSVVTAEISAGNNLNCFYAVPNGNMSINGRGSTGDIPVQIKSELPIINLSFMADNSGFQMAVNGKTFDSVGSARPGPTGPATFRMSGNSYGQGHMENFTLYNKKLSTDKMKELTAI